MVQTIFQVDAFTDRPFAGNPAGVCVLPAWPDDAWMQAVALEMNLSETAFLVRQEDGFGLRWFTPKVEVSLCGHATLASAHLLWEAGYLPADEMARFHTRSGLLTARQAGGWIEMDFPADPETPVEAPPGLLQALGVEARYVGRNRWTHLVLVDVEEQVRRLDPDLRALASSGSGSAIVTAPATTPGFDFVSRFFAPALGIDEDPVTGAAHCCLGPFWSARLGKPEVIGCQCSARGGVVRVRPQGERVLLAGQAVTVLRGELRV